jgi:glycerol kinase
MCGLAGETTVVWDRETGQPLHNAIVWLDNRTADVCHVMVQQLGSKDHFRPGVLAL